MGSDLAFFIAFSFPGTLRTPFVKRDERGIYVIPPAGMLNLHGQNQFAGCGSGGEAMQVVSMRLSIVS
jgi:hypothetical protein